MTDKAKEPKCPTIDDATMEEGRALARKAMEAPQRAGRRTDAPLREDSFTFKDAHTDE